MGRQIHGYQLFPPQILTAVLGGSVPDVPGKFDLVELIDNSVDRQIMAERESFEKGQSGLLFPLPHDLEP